jgi:hypothetical protein
MNNTKNYLCYYGTFAMQNRNVLPVAFETTVVTNNFQQKLSIPIINALFKRLKTILSRH